MQVQLQPGVGGRRDWCAAFSLTYPRRGASVESGSYWASLTFSQRTRRSRRRLNFFGQQLPTNIHQALETRTGLSN